MPIQLDIQPTTAVEVDLSWGTVNGDRKSSRKRGGTFAGDPWIRIQAHELVIYF